MSTETIRQSPPSAVAPSLWRNRDYLLLWSGQILSTVGTQASTLAFPLLLLMVTRSPAAAGFASALRALPYLFISLPAGALIDRWDRKRVMLLCDSGRAIALGSIPLAIILGRLTPLQLYAVSLIEGSLFVLFDIAEAACLPRVVSREQLPAATAQNNVTYSVSTLIGPSIGGALFGVARVLPFVADAVSYMASVISLLFIHTPFQGEHGVTRRRLHVEIGEGLAWLWHHPLIRFIAFITGISNLVGNGIFLMAIVIAQEQHATSTVIGLIFALGGIGGIVGSVAAVRLRRRFTYGQVIITCVWSWAILTPLFAIAPNPLVLGLLMASTFVSGPVYNVVQMSYRLALIPDALQGRVNSVFRLIAYSGQPLGYALAGVLIETIGAVPAVLIFSVPYVIAALLTTFNADVRNARPLEAVQPA